MHGGEMIHWEQRVEKEEKAMCATPPAVVGPLHRAWHVVEAQRPRRAHQPRSMTRPASLSTLPDDLQAIGSWPLIDRPLTTMRAGSSTLKFRTVEEPAQWVPGKGKIVQYRPEFSLLREEAPQRRPKQVVATRDPWRLPAAGMKATDITRKNAPAKLSYESSE
eukprot:CAMPEP_0171098888 /NCGR_PEP_ID=MMETSP0766_2-20121228/49777_1 /TAXON_ID=439317 /ORGANISM="Gambierdiscus australes, Strain CAWD 149" /LENGTH=162 /DNA_ID=CAMNT_0011558359 /DNA_START=130 /DNA_END=615 /DNA_ORIENTATION=-